jgi:hypothetical protein
MANLVSLARKRIIRQKFSVSVSPSNHFAAFKGLEDEDISISDGLGDDADIDGSKA